MDGETLTIPVAESPLGTRGQLCGEIEVRSLGLGNATDWDRYVEHHPGATAFHTLAWMRVLETLGNRPRYLMALRGGEVVGVLPLFECSQFPFRRELISLPHTNFAGPLADGEEEERALLDKAADLAKGLNVRVLLLKDRHPGKLDLPQVEGFVTFERSLPRSAEAIEPSLNKGARYWVRRGATRNGLSTTIEPNLADFYALLSTSYRRLGTPLYPRQFFEALLAEFGNDALLLTVRRGSASLAAVLAVRFRDTLTSLFSGEASDARNLGVNPFKYCRLMELAVRQGVARYNFGRSRLTNPGAIDFKRHMGFESTRLPYRVLVLSKGFRPSDPNRGVFRLASRAWSCLPRSLAEGIGPRVVRMFPH